MQANEPNQPSVRAPSSAGFTLVELLIAMLILAIGILASLSMQFTALGGAMMSRDNSNASDVARRVMHVMRLESQQWRTDTIANSVNTSTFTNSAFSNSPVLPSVGAGWTPLFDAPVDSRLTIQGATRYCAYARGEYLAPDVFQLQVAVVFPPSNAIIEDNDCVALESSVITLGAEVPPDQTGSVQMTGYRVQYFGTQITRRGFLPRAGTGSGGV